MKSISARVAVGRTRGGDRFALAVISLALDEVDASGADTEIDNSRAPQRYC